MMSVIFHEKSKVFHLTNSYVSYIIRIMENGQLENLYYGKAVHDSEDFDRLHEEGWRSQAAVCMPDPSDLSMHYARQEYPVYGTGDFRSPVCTIRQENGSRIVDFKYVSYEISDGKPMLEGLPATYVESDGEAQTLTVRLHDSLMNTDLYLYYTLYRDYPVITRHARFVHAGDDSIVLERAMSAGVEFLDMDFDFLQLSGAWGRERYPKRRRLEMGLQGIQGLAGTTAGAEQNPFVALLRPDATEDFGEVYGFSLVYSGNFLANVEVSTFDMTRLSIGINPENFAWKLEKGQSFTTPEVVMVYSDSGLGGMSRTYHRLYRSRLIRGIWRDKARPILLNNWEGTYFDFNEEIILKMAREAKEVGVELFVLDDGWFGERNDDRRGLGDWFCNLEKIPSGIDGLSRKVEEIGLKFGLWVELEMINEDSDLYRAHPDWLIQAPGRYRCQTRHQYVLDYSRKEVVDYIYGMMSELLKKSKISYIKWDMNRYMTEPFSASLPADRQGEMMHRYILGVYSLYERLTSEFPEILFESCASGGARFDPGMLYYAPQTWCSDDSDANERLKIQYGTSVVYPISSIGAHVSAVPNHQVMRKTPLHTRASVAYFGTFGYELVLGKLSDFELSEVRRQIDFMKRHRELIQIDGDFYRISSPFEHNETGWMTVSRDRKSALALYAQTLNKVNASWVRFKLKGLDPDTKYRVRYEIVEEPRDFYIYGMEPTEGKVETREFSAYGDELMNIGIVVDRIDFFKLGGDFAAFLYEIDAI